MDSEESGLWHWTNLRQSLVARDDLYSPVTSSDCLEQTVTAVTASFLQGSDEIPMISMGLETSRQRALSLFGLIYYLTKSNSR